MRRKNLLLLFALAGALSLLATGCQNSAQTEEEIVLPKQEEETGDGGKPCRRKEKNRQPVGEPLRTRYRRRSVLTGKAGANR